MKKINNILLTLVFVFTLNIGAFSWETIPQDILSHADKGVYAVYNLDLDTANKELSALLKEHPDYPLGLFGITMIQWSRYEYEFEKSNKEQADIFEKMINSSIDGIKKWIKNNKPEAQAYLALGGVYGIKARFLLANKSYITAYFAGRKGLRYMNKATKLNPKMADAYLGKAIYEYYAGTLPSVVQILAKLVVSGDADKGIEYLNMIKDNGRYSSDTAKLLLVEIAIESDKYHNPALAQKYINEIIEKYPQNPLYKFVAVIAGYENKDYDSVRKGAREFLENIGKKPFYSKIYIARSYTALASADIQQGKYEDAKNLLEESRIKTQDQEMSRWQLWNIFRLAQCYDALGNRQKALTLYKQIIKTDPNWDINIEAEKYLETPFVAGTDIGHMSPP